MLVDKTMNENGFGLVQVFLDYIKDYGSRVELIRYDISIDIPVERQFVTLNKDMRKYTKLWVTDVEDSYNQILQDMEKKQISYKIEVKSKDLSNCTEYLGQRNKGGFVKLYNKQIESNLTYPLTRLEITLDNLEYKNFQQCLPSVHYLKNLNLCDLAMLNDTDRVIMLLLLESDKPFEMINMLGRGKQAKFKELISKNETELFNISFSIYMQFVLSIKNIIDN